MTNCTYIPMEFLNEKFLMVGILGAGMSIIGMGLNSIAMVILGNLTKKQPSPLVYLLTIAILDFLFMWAYILILAVQIYYDQFEDLRLYILWHRYLPLTHAIAKIIQTATTYLLVAASIERFVDVSGLSDFVSHWQTSHRLLVVLTVLIFSTSLRGVSYWELEIHLHLECEGFARYSLELSSFSSSEAYVFYSLYLINFLQVFLPFFLLLFLNIAIVFKIRRALKKNLRIFRRSSVWECADTERNLRSATSMLITVISTYLIFNSLSCALTFIEHIHKDMLDSNEIVYTFIVDFINLLYMVTSATRPLVYVICSEKIRAEVLNILGGRRKFHYNQKFRVALMQSQQTFET